MCTLVNSEEPDEMSHNIAFHQGLYYFLRQKQSPEKEINFYLEIITCDPSIYTMFIVSNQKEEAIVHQGLSMTNRLPFPRYR